MPSRAHAARVMTMMMMMVMVHKKKSTPAPAFASHGAHRPSCSLFRGGCCCCFASPESQDGGPGLQWEGGVLQRLEPAHVVRDAPARVQGKEAEARADGAERLGVVEHDEGVRELLRDRLVRLVDRLHRRVQGGGRCVATGGGGEGRRRGALRVALQHHALVLYTCLEVGFGMGVAWYDDE